MKSSAGFTDNLSMADTIGGGANMFGGLNVNIDNINIASYQCDFGNVVVGQKKRKTFRLTNVGKIPVTFNFDKKVLTQAGISIEPDKY